MSCSSMGTQFMLLVLYAHSTGKVTTRRGRYRHRHKKAK